MPLTTILLFSDVLLCSHKMYPRANSWAPARADPSCFLQDLENAYHGQPSLTVVGKESAKKKESQVDMLSCGVQSEQRGHGLCPLGDAGLCAEADTGHSLWAGGGGEKGAAAPLRPVWPAAGTQVCEREAAAGAQVCERGSSWSSGLWEKGSRWNSGFWERQKF